MSGEVINLISTFLALAAVCVAAWQVKVGAMSARQQNSLSVVSEVFAQWRSAEFGMALRRLLSLTDDELARDGFEALPADRRADAYEVCYFFDYLGTLVVFGIVAEEIVLAVMANRIMQVWIALRPLIDRERELRVRTYPADATVGFLVYFEHLVKRTLQLGGRQAADRLRRRVTVLRLEPGDLAGI